MTVDELRKALAQVPGDTKVRLVPPTNDDEWHATVVSMPRRCFYVLICASNAEIPVGEKVLHDDNEAVD